MSLALKFSGRQLLLTFLSVVTVPSQIDVAWQLLFFKIFEKSSEQSSYFSLF